MQGVNLSGSNLRGANLINTDLRNANLINTDLRDTCLRYKDLQGAIFCNTIIPEKRTEENQLHEVEHYELVDESMLEIEMLSNDEFTDFDDQYFMRLRNETQHWIHVHVRFHCPSNATLLKSGNPPTQVAPQPTFIDFIISNHPNLILQILQVGL